MIISENELKKIEPINRILEQRFGLRLEPASLDHLVDICAIYDAKRDALLAKLGEMARFRDDYTKAFLLSEAARLLLREIAPKRRKKPKKNQRG